MRKRNKKRVPQDILPWVRVVSLDEDKINIFNKKTTRWTSGSSRNWQNTLFMSQASRKFSNVLLKSLLADQNSIHRKFIYQARQKLRKTDSKSSQYKQKNFCLILGKNRTYNRKLFISRQILRKLSSNNAIISIIK